MLVIPLLLGLTRTLGSPVGEEGIGDPYACGSKLHTSFTYQHILKEVESLAHHVTPLSDWVQWHTTFHYIHL
jgi:hypothetical protein